VNEIICDPQEQLASPPCCVLANHASNMHRADCGWRLWDSCPGPRVQAKPSL